MAVCQETEGHPLPTLRVLIVNSAHLMAKHFVPACPGWDIKSDIFPLFKPRNLL
jgi:hypothetical protein